MSLSISIVSVYGKHFQNKIYLQQNYSSESQSKLSFAENPILSDLYLYLELPWLLSDQWLRCPMSIDGIPFLQGTQLL